MSVMCNNIQLYFQKSNLNQRWLQLLQQVVENISGA